MVKSISKKLLFILSLTIAAEQFLECMEALGEVKSASGCNEQKGAITVFNETAIQLFAEETPISSVALSPDGKTVLTAHWSGEVYVWDVATGNQLARLEGHETPISSVAFSPDGTIISTGSCDTTVCLWDSRTRRQLQELKGHTSSITSVAFSRDGEFIITGSHDATARLWRVVGKDLLGVPKNSTVDVQFLKELKGHDKSVSSVAYGFDEETFLTGSYDKTARLWDAKTGKPVVRLEGHRALISSVAYSPDCKLTLTGSADNTALLWDVRTGKAVVRLEGHRALISSVSYSPDGTTVCTASADNTARIWDVRTGKQLQELKGHEALVSSVVYSSDGKTVLTGSLDKKARLWGAATKKELSELKRNEALALGSLTPSVNYNSDKRTALAERLDKKAYSLNESSEGTNPTSEANRIGARIGTISKPKAPPLCFKAAILKELHMGSPIVSVAFNPRGDVVIITVAGERRGSNRDDNRVYLWDVATGETIAELKGFTGGVASEVASGFYSPDWKSVLICHYDYGAGSKQVRLWNVEKGKQLQEFKGYKNTITSVAYSPDGKTILTGSSNRHSEEGSAHLWSVSTGELLREFKNDTNGVTLVAYSPDGKTVLTGSWSATTRLWDSETGKLLREFKKTMKPVSAPSHKSTGSLWDSVLEGKLQKDTHRKLEDYKGTKVATVAFSLDGRTILTGLNKNSALLWDVATGRLLHKFKEKKRNKDQYNEHGEVGSVASVAYSPDGKTVLIGYHAYFGHFEGRTNNIACLWDVTTGERLGRLVSLSQKDKSQNGHRTSVSSVAFSPDGKTALTVFDDGHATLWGLSNLP